MYHFLKSAFYFNLPTKFLRKSLNGHISFRWNSKSFKTVEDIKKIRNIGIIAHIDAGKTTTTERMLYYSGFTNMMGEVHDGDTVMDYMVQERERGITITLAAITFNWKDHKINLIDTPGHVDFTFEVERSLSVLDGAVVILDASAGVEVQTLKVWEQANRYGVPCVIYLNKLDKPAADIDMCLQSIKNKLKITPLMLQVPIGKDKQFNGIIDLLSPQKHVWDKQGSEKDGRNFITHNLDTGDKKTDFESIVQEREKVIENIVDFDDAVADKYLTDGIDSLTIADLQAALRRITLKRTAIPILCGSSYKNVGVQLLMDAVVNYLPDPSERNHYFVNNDSKELCALAFKIIHNKNKELLTFLRLYSGSLKSGQQIYNKNREKSEKVGKLIVPLADDFKEVPLALPGNIIVATGFKEVITGDLIFSSGSAASKVTLKKKQSDEALGPLIQVPDPVFFCTIEPPSVGFQKRLDFALQCLQREDPTFQVEFDESIGQTIIMGMGELHIDIIKERIRVEYGIDAYLGPLQVAYRETLGEVVEHTHVLDKTVSGSKHFAKITLRLYPHEKAQKHINVIVTKENDLGKIRSDYFKAVNAGVKGALNNGPILSFPVINVGMDLLWLQVGRGTSLAMLSAAASQCVTAAFRKTQMHLLEPIMNLSIAVDKGFAGRVINDLSQKRSQILNMELREDLEIIQALTPLSELKGYSTELRALTAGTCSFTIEFSQYQKMDSNELAKTIEEVTGFAPR
ncbi:ribosome-releasing factor 2, mitochondrial [Caerostris darwini]|uniref:Ribosome-releasing factor 2, mitochondrial n=1 Tax=Caerostris darwini TaxID=1538125 RepID=A0AAV4MV86_9ARAC|nr:ribosome-releasing factor 2, mitochondrial [Caerostris darwini]